MAPRSVDAHQPGEPLCRNGKFVRTVLIDGSVWFLANDLRSALGLHGSPWYELSLVATTDKRSVSRLEAPFLFDVGGGPFRAIVSQAGCNTLEALACRRASRVRRPQACSITVIGDLAVIPLTLGYEAVIASADLHLVEGRKWSVKLLRRKLVAMGRFKQPDGTVRTCPMSILPLSQEPMVRLREEAPGISADPAEISERLSIKRHAP